MIRPLGKTRFLLVLCPTSPAGAIYAMSYSTDGKNWTAASTVVGTDWRGVASFPDADDPVDTNGKLQRFKALDMPPGDYRAVMKADQDMVWKLYYRKAWMGI